MISSTIHSSSFFSPGVCHHCKRVESTGDSDGLGTKLFACGGCRFFYYCSKDCQKNDRPFHNQFCAVASKLRGKTPDLFDTQTLENEQSFVDHRRKLIVKFAECMFETFGRSIATIEKHALTYPRFCTTCFKVNCDTWTCGRCHNAFLCASCGPWPSSSSSSSPSPPSSPPPAGGPPHRGCPQYALALACDQLAHTRGHAPLVLPAGRAAAPLLPLPRGWGAYLRARPFPDAAAATRAETILRTSHLTFPLTVLWLLERLPGLDLAHAEQLNVHIIGAASQPDIHPQGKYEEICHVLPCLRRLTLWMVGPSVPPSLSGTFSAVQLCNECQAAGCQIEMRYLTETYHGFMDSAIYQPPDLAVAFNAGLHHHLVDPEGETWRASLRRMAQARLRVGFTAYNAEECRVDAQTYEDAGAAPLTLGPVRNPFRSLRPHKEGFSAGYTYAWDACLFAAGDAGGGPAPLPGDNLESVKERSDENERLLVQR